LRRSGVLESVGHVGNGPAVAEAEPDRTWRSLTGSAASERGHAENKPWTFPAMLHSGGDFAGASSGLLQGTPPPAQDYLIEIQYQSKSRIDKMEK